MGVKTVKYTYVFCLPIPGVILNDSEIMSKEIIIPLKMQNFTLKYEQIYL